MKKFLNYFNILRALSIKGHDMLKIIVWVGILLVILLSFPMAMGPTIEAVKSFFIIIGWTMVFTVVLNTQKNKKEKEENEKDD